MISDRAPHSSADRLKSLQCRELRGGLWVAVARNSDPLVVDRTSAEALTNAATASTMQTKLGVELLEAVRQAGFIRADSDTRPLPEEPVGRRWRVARATLWVTLLGLLAAAILLLVKQGAPTGSALVPAQVPVAAGLALSLAVATVTATLHECLHVLYGRTSTARHSGVTLNLRLAVATTDLTHTWAWGASARSAAVAAGISADLAVLVSSLIVRGFWPNWVASLIAGTVLARIIWQFRVHRRSDGRHLVKFLIDDPLVDVETWGQIRLGRVKSLRARNVAWIVTVFAGVTAECLLVALWLIPAAYQLFTRTSRL